MKETVGNQRIAKNIFYVYVRVVVTTILGLITTRFALSALGQSDFGLYSVVGGIVAVLNVLSTALSTTTRRYINIEMGLPQCNLNKVFNICMVIHIGLALFMLLLAESIGIIYINTFLNVSADRLSTSHVIFQISTLVSVISLINVPYQSLMAANEQFKTVAIIDILFRAIQLLLVIALLFYNGNRLILYAMIMCVSTIMSLLCYSILCKQRWPTVIKWQIYKDKAFYKDVLIFNNYTALGAGSYLARSQGSNMIVNFFFGTIVNGAFSIAYMLENYTLMIVSNLSTAASPQITQNYSSGNINRSFYLSSKINRYSILFMMSIVFFLLVELEYILTLWLGTIPEGAIILCRLTLICAFVRALTEGIPPFLQATGKIKWFQIAGAVTDIIVLPIACLLFYWGYPSHYIIICYILFTFLYKILTIYLLFRIIHFDVKSFFVQSYLPSFIVLLCYSLFYLSLGICKEYFYIHPLVVLFCTIIYSIIIIYLLGLTKGEKESLINIIYRYASKQ